MPRVPTCPVLHMQPQTPPRTTFDGGSGSPAPSSLVTLRAQRSGWEAVAEAVEAFWDAVGGDGAVADDQTGHRWPGDGEVGETLDGDAPLEGPLGDAVDVVHGGAGG